MKLRSTEITLTVPESATKLEYQDVEHDETDATTLRTLSTVEDQHKALATLEFAVGKEGTVRGGRFYSKVLPWGTRAGDEVKVTMVVPAKWPEPVPVRAYTQLSSSTMHGLLGDLIPPGAPPPPAADPRRPTPPRAASRRLRPPHAAHRRPTPAAAPHRQGLHRPRDRRVGARHHGAHPAAAARRQDRRDARRRQARDPAQARGGAARVDGRRVGPRRGRRHPPPRGAPAAARRLRLRGVRGRPEPPAARGEAGGRRAPAAPPPAASRRLTPPHAASDRLPPRPSLRAAPGARAEQKTGRHLHLRHLRTRRAAADGVAPWWAAPFEGVIIAPGEDPRDIILQWTYNKADHQRNLAARPIVDEDVGLAPGAPPPAARRPPHAASARRRRRRPPLRPPPQVRRCRSRRATTSPSRRSAACRAAPSTAAPSAAASSARTTRRRRPTTTRTTPASGTSRASRPTSR